MMIHELVVNLGTFHPAGGFDRTLRDIRSEQILRFLKGPEKASFVSLMTGMLNNDEAASKKLVELLTDDLEQALKGVPCVGLPLIVPSSGEGEQPVCPQMMTHTTRTHSLRC